MAEPTLDSVQRHSGLKRTYAEGMSKAARTCRATGDLREHHHILDNTPARHSMVRLASIFPISNNALALASR